MGARPEAAAAFAGGEIALRILLLALLFQLTAAQAARLAWIPNPRAGNAGWVSDPSHRLRPQTLAELNERISALERETGAEIAVVAVDSTSGFEPFEVALALHRAWGVGKREFDNGIVLLWVPTQRAVHVSVGYGLEGVLPDARVGRIRDEQIFPAFRRGEFDAGVIAGVRALADAAREEKTPRRRMAPTMPGDDPRRLEQPLAPQRGPVVQEPSGRPGRTAAVVATAIALPLALLGGVAGFVRYRRRRPRRCPRGHGFMRLIEDSADEPYLAEGERLEEKLRSVDYDIWLCDVCGHRTKFYRRRWFTSYQKCPRCNHRTVKVSKRTTVRATTSHAGLEHVTESCHFCGWAKEYDRTIPKISTSSSSGSGGSSSRSSGGGSFGGGSAGGGGAGGRY